MALIAEIKVTPSSGRSTFQLDASGKLKAFLKSPPVDGRANKELIELLAKALGCPRFDVSIIAGATSRNKKVKIHLSLTHDDLLRKLGYAVQTKIIK